MSNQAAWLVAAGKVPFEVKDAPMPTPGPGQILVKSHAWAMNPVDYLVQRYSIFPLSYPFILGEDAAGQVVALGPDVATFAVGDRVIVHSQALTNGRAEEAAFQKYVLAAAQVSAKIPAALDYAVASGLPLAISTAAHGLYGTDLLALPHPTLAPKPTGQALLVWGGSSAVGSAAIQVAVASGLQVVSTASARNHALVSSLGAAAVFDHASPTVVDDIVAFLAGKTLAGAYAAVANKEAVEACADVLARSQGGKTVALTLPPPEKLPAGISTAQIQATSIFDTPVAPAVWGQYIPAALANGSFKNALETRIVGSGLDKIQEACDTLQKGVSAAKIVVTL